MKDNELQSKVRSSLVSLSSIFYCVFDFVSVIIVMVSSPSPKLRLTE